MKKLLAILILSLVGCTPTAVKEPVPTEPRDLTVPCDCSISGNKEVTIEAVPPDTTFFACKEFKVDDTHGLMVCAGEENGEKGFLKIPFAIPDTI